jgi:ABC-type transport system substrate-binding protein
VNRRSILATAASLSGAALVNADLADAAPRSVTEQENAVAQELPADAAPPERQVLVMPDDVTVTKVFDIFERVYERPYYSAFDLSSEPLVRVDKNLDLVPGAAESWSSDEAGTVWTFRIRQGLTWSDGTPVTAHDWVASFQYAADPSHAWDFTWYFEGVIKNWSQVVNPGEGVAAIDPGEIGVRVGADDYELVVETEAPAPYLPAMLVYSNPLSKKALEAVGPLYDTDPATAVSSGPFILNEFQHDQQVVYARNEQYTGTMRVPTSKVIVKLASPADYFTMYQANEVDFVPSPPPAAVDLLLADEAPAGEVHVGTGDFPTWYVFFDVTVPPFDNLKVRQAWSHAIDRDLLQQQVLGPGGTPAYSWLAPGFPGSQREALKDIQRFDPELARSLLAEAGFPDGKDFPKLQMWLRVPSPLDKTVAGAIASMLKEHLNIEVELLEKDQQGFTAALYARPTEIQLGFLRYGMDFLDPANMLGAWRGGVRHTWSNDEYDAKVQAAAVFMGDPAERIAMFQEAERVLVTDVPAVFVYHGTPVQLIKPWVKGAFLDPDEGGVRSMHWPGFTAMCTVPEELYISADAPDRG